MSAKMTVSEIAEFLERDFPQLKSRFDIESIDPQGVTVGMDAGEDELRPGGTVSGPTLFSLADLAFYAAVLSRLGAVALAVTTSATINFMRRAEPGRLRAEARILKLGRALCVGDVLVFSEHHVEPIAHASMTYALPPPSRS